MAQVKLIEQPEQFKLVTIQITFETQEELNAMDAITGYMSSSFSAVSCESDVFKTTSSDWYNVANAIYNQIKQFSK